jgi:hypothetical protein
MVNFNIVSVAVKPLEAYPPLVIDTDTVKPYTVAAQSFQPAAGVQATRSKR